MECYMLGTMLYLEAQKGKGATNTEEFQHKIGGNASYTKILMRGKKGCGQLTSNET